MRRSTSRRRAARHGPNRRLLVGITALVVGGGLFGFAQISNAETEPPAQQNNGLQILGDSCADSRLTPHDGFQNGSRCVNTEMGEVAAAAQNPSLLITDAPRWVRVGQAFRLRVSTRNLVRDRFLGAAAGGYYLESSFLNADGLQRGHFHVACRMLATTNTAPDPEPVPAFFKAVEDGGGGARPDTVTVEVTGMPAKGTAQCAVWAGDGSHRIPMMQRANQAPAADAVRIRVVRGQQPPPDSGDNDPPPPAPDDDPPPPPGDDPSPTPGDDPTEDPAPAPDDDPAPVPDEDPVGDGANPPPAKDDDEGTSGDADSDADDPAPADPAPDRDEPAPADDGDRPERPAEDDADEQPVSGGAVSAGGAPVTPIAQEPVADAGDELALTGANKTVAVMVGGALLVIIGAALIGSARRRDPDADWS